MERKGIGKILKEEREKRGITIDYLSQVTKISKEFIRAIEEERFDSLPGDVYVRGFIRNLSIALGLDPERMKELYRSQRALLYEEEVLAEAKQKLPSYEADIEKGIRPRKPWLLILLLLVMITGGIFYFYASKTGTIDLFTRTFIRSSVTPSVSPPSEGTKETKSEPEDKTVSYATVPVAGAVTETVSSEVSEPQSLPVEQETPSKKTQRFSFKVVAIGRCWIRVVADGQKVFEGVLVKGDEKTWEAEENITVRFGNISGVKVYYNYKEVSLPPSKTGVVDMTFPP